MRIQPFPAKSKFLAVLIGLTQNPNLLLRRVSLAWHRLILSGWTRLTIRVDQFS